MPKVKSIETVDKPVYIPPLAGKSPGVGVTEDQVRQFLVNPKETRLKLILENVQAMAYAISEKGKRAARTAGKRDFNQLRHLVISLATLLDKGFPEHSNQQIDREVKILVQTFAGSDIGSKMYRTVTTPQVIEVKATLVNEPGEKSAPLKDNPF